MNVVAGFPSLIARQECDRWVEDAGVQVWKCWLGEAVKVEPLGLLLSPDEADRATRFVFVRDRRRFIAAAALRIILGEHLEESPERIEFAYGINGKPEIGDAWRQSGIQFNLAHSGDWALAAVTVNKRVGVDLEQLRRMADGRAIAQRHFSPAEMAQLESLPGELREEAFLRCWTRKEAYLKALGCGLSMSLDAFDVSLLPKEPPALLAARDDPREPMRWRMAELWPDAGYLGALVVETGQGW